MQIEEGSAMYYGELDLSNFDALGSCTNIASVGLKYHIHQSWTNTSDSSSFTSGCSQAAGHYDPFLGCSSNSQYVSTECVELSRTSSLGYTYSCNPTLYNNGNYSNCEVGDLSGKFGILNDTGTSMFYSTGVLTDFYPALISNYKYNMKNSEMWSSMVFHCGTSAAPRLVCADFSTTDMTACAPAFDDYFATSFDEDDDDIGKDSISTGGIVAIGLCSFVFGVILALNFAYIYFKKREEPLLKS